MRLTFVFSLLFVFFTGLAAFRLAIRVCFKDMTATNDKNNCAYCNPKTLLRIMKNCTNSDDGIPAEFSSSDIGPGNIWSELHKQCILDKCREEYPTQRVLPTIFPIDAPRGHIN